MRVYNRTRNQELGKIQRANTFRLRLFGLLGKSPDTWHEGLWLVPCQGIHTFGMRYPIDIIFLDFHRKVMRVSANISPFLLGPVCWKAYSVIEFFHGKWNGSSLKIGDQLEFLNDTV